MILNQVERLEKVDVLTPFEITSRLIKLNASTSDDDLAILIKDISALIISYDTVTGELKDGLFLLAAIEQLLQPLLSDKYIKLRIEGLVANNHMIPFTFIYSPEEEEVIREVESTWMNRSGTVEINVPVVHAHIDTTTLIEPFSSTTTYIDNNENTPDSLLFGRGANDMKSQIAVMIISLYLLHSINEKPPIMVLSSDEEQGIPYSRDLFATMYLRNLVIDLEPCDPRFYFNEVWPSVHLNMFISPLHPNDIVDKWNEQLKLKSVKEYVERITAQFYPKPHYDILVTADPDRISISIIDTIKYVEIDLINMNLVNIIKECIENYFHFERATQSEGYDFRSLTTPENKLMLAEVYKRRYFEDGLTSEQAVTRVLRGEEELMVASLRHNFASAATIAYGGLLDNVFLTGPRELGEGRHSKFEGVKLNDNIVTTKNLVEMVCRGRKIFTEA